MRLLYEISTPPLHLHIKNESNLRLYITQSKHKRNSLSLALAPPTEILNKISLTMELATSSFDQKILFPKLTLYCQPVFWS